MPRRPDSTWNDTPYRKNPSDFEECKSWFKILRETGDLDAAKKLISEHTFDLSNDHELPHYVDTTRRNLQAIQNERHRIVYILMKSGALTLEAICSHLKMNKRTLYEYYRQAQIDVNA